MYVPRFGNQALSAVRVAEEPQRGDDGEDVGSSLAVAKRGWGMRSVGNVTAAHQLIDIDSVHAAKHLESEGKDSEKRANSTVEGHPVS